LIGYGEKFRRLIWEHTHHSSRKAQRVPMKDSLADSLIRLARLNIEIELKENEWMLRKAEINFQSKQNSPNFQEWSLCEFDLLYVQGELSDLKEARDRYTNLISDEVEQLIRLQKAAS
jgi:hypothetical protein